MNSQLTMLASTENIHVLKSFGSQVWVSLDDDDDQLDDGDDFVGHERRDFHGCYDGTFSFSWSTFDEMVL